MGSVERFYDTRIVDAERERLDALVLRAEQAAIEKRHILLVHLRGLNKDDLTLISRSGAGFVILKF